MTTSVVQSASREKKSEHRTRDESPGHGARRIKAAIFDLDGVLVDTAEFHYRAWCELALALGFDFSREANEQLKGVSRMQSLEILLAHGGLTVDDRRKAELAETKNRTYQKLLRELDPSSLLPGAGACLIECRCRGLKIALGSASKNAGFVLERLGIVDLFDAIVDGTKVSASKPDPEIFLRGACELGVAPEECVVFEDAAAGIVAAKRAGMLAIGVGEPANLPGADRVIAGLKDFQMTLLTSIADNPKPVLTAPLIDFATKPFHLGTDDIAWVRATHRKLSLEEKIGQLFCLVVRETQQERELDQVLSVVKPGGFMFRARPAAEAQRLHRYVQSRSAVPLLLAANLERGGNGVTDDGTHFSSPLGIAATNDEEQAYRLGVVCGREARAIGSNWSFAPVVDVDFNFHNPITNTRTYGSDPARVLRFARAYLRGLR